MFTTLNFCQAMWRQFGAAIDMLEQAIVTCPEQVWISPSNFWYRSYHTIFYLDYYLSQNPASFAPPAPFTLSEFKYGKLPERSYSKEELLSYLEHSRDKCFSLLHQLAEKEGESRFVNKAKDYSMVEMLMYNLRHVQHHVGQLNLLLRQHTNAAPGWISEAQRPFED